MYTFGVSTIINPHLFRYLSSPCTPRESLESLIPFVNKFSQDKNSDSRFYDRADRIRIIYKKDQFSLVIVERTRNVWINNNEIRDNTMNRKIVKIDKSITRRDFTSLSILKRSFNSSINTERTVLNFPFPTIFQNSIHFSPLLFSTFSPNISPIPYPLTCCCRNKTFIFTERHRSRR